MRSVRELRAAPLATLATLEPADRAALLLPHVEPYARGPWRRLRLAVALPLADGEPLLRALVDHHRAEYRAAAWPALLACAELNGEPGQFARVAADCERAWHDRDEVRGAALRRLADVAPRLLSALPGHVLRDAVLTTVRSRDSTAVTVQAAQRLLYRAARHAVAQGRAERSAYIAGLLGEFATASRHTPALTALNLDEAGARTGALGGVLPPEDATTLRETAPREATPRGVTPGEGGTSHGGGTSRGRGVPRSDDTPAHPAGARRARHSTATLADDHNGAGRVAGASPGSAPRPGRRGVRHRPPRRRPPARGARRRGLDAARSPAGTALR